MRGARYVPRCPTIVAKAAYRGLNGLSGVPFMADVFELRRVLGMGIAAALVLCGMSGTSTAEPQPASDIVARYRLVFNGFDVGTYNFHSKFNGKTYDANSGTKISALFGAFTWKGAITGSGAMDRQLPHPTSYDMSYKSNSKSYQVKMSFNGSRVASILLQPNKPPSPEAVKLKPEHLENVYDPMSALMAISSTTASDACNRTIPVFDGKARFDLKLTPKGREAVKDKHPTGQPTELLVCRVKYVPIAGHKPKDFKNPWVEYDNIEIALRQIPSAGLFVPYRIKVPTTIGSADVVADEIDIKAGNDTQIALRQ